MVQCGKTSLGPQNASPMTESLSHAAAAALTRLAAVARLVASRSAALGVAWALLAPGTALAQPARCPALQPEAVLTLINTARAAGGLCGSRGGQAASAAVRWSDGLQAMAQQQATWMADHGRLAHTGRGGETLRQRAQQADYRYFRIVENLAHGQRTAAHALDGWLASDSHCVNVYDSAVTEMALACVPGRDGRPFWALLMAKPEAPVASPPAAAPAQ